MATTEEIAAQDFILTPGRYVGIAVQAEDSEPFAAKMERLTGELSELFAQSHELEAEIRRQFEFTGNDYTLGTVAYCDSTPLDGAVGAAALAVLNCVIHTEKKGVCKNVRVFPYFR